MTAHKKRLCQIVAADVAVFQQKKLNRADYCG